MLLQWCTSGISWYVVYVCNLSFATLILFPAGIKWTPCSVHIQLAIDKVSYVQLAHKEILKEMVRYLKNARTQEQFDGAGALFVRILHEALGEFTTLKLLQIGDGADSILYIWVFSFFFFFSSTYPIDAPLQILSHYIR